MPPGRTRPAPRSHEASATPEDAHRVAAGSRLRQAMARIADQAGPWLAAAAVGLFVLAALLGRAGAAAWSGLRRVPPALDRIERRAVPALAAAGAATATAVGWTVDALARGLHHAGRQAGPPAAALLWDAARLVGAGSRWTVRGLAQATRRARPHLPSSGTALRVGLLGVGAVVVLVLVAHPLLVFASTAVSLDEHAPDAAAFPPLDERSTVHAADGSVLAILHGEVDRRVVSLDQVPGHVRDAVLVAEDGRFYEHRGYDLEAIARAALANVRAGDVVQGGSTLTQQLAKQNYVGNAQALTRKMSELVHAVALERAFTKQQLLERYLNQVYFGSGAYGIAAAAEHFFAIPPEELSVAQAALLAGLIRAPAALDPREHTEAAIHRRNTLLLAMADAGMLSADETAQAVAEPLQLAAPRSSVPAEPHVVEAIKQEFLADPAFGATRKERARRLLTGGLRIHTTIDPRLQGLASEVVQTFEGQASTAVALVAVEPASGKVRSLHSGLEFATEQFNLATQGRRQPGSAFKPFVLAAALEEPGVSTRGLRGDSARFTVPGAGEPWEVRNFEGATYGSLDGHDALVRSVNTAFADLSVRLGVEPVARLAGELGIDVEAAFGPPSSRGPAVALGGLTHGVSPLEMAAAYAAFGNGGIAVRPYLIERVTDADGRELLARTPQARQAIEPEVNAKLVAALTDVVRRGTGRGARLPGWRPIGKTGTTQEGADAWFVGVVPGLSVAVWTGNPDAQTPVPGLTGGSVPAPIWRAYLTRALEGAEPVDFPDAPSRRWTAAPG